MWFVHIVRMWNRRVKVVRRTNGLVDDGTSDGSDPREANNGDQKSNEILHVTMTAYLADAERMKRLRFDALMTQHSSLQFHELTPSKNIQVNNALMAMTTFYGKSMQSPLTGVCIHTSITNSK